MDEQFYDSNNSYENPSQEIPVYTPPTPKKREKKNRLGFRVCALALVFALLGGALGAGGVMWYESSRGQTGTVSKNETAMLQGIRENSVLNTVTVDSGKEMTAAEVRNLVRGEEGTYVSLTVLRRGERVTLSVERRQVQTVVASGRMLSGDIGLVTIENFDARCAEEAIAAIDGLLAQGAEKLIFDVRNNPGGYAKELVKVLDYLLPEGELFRTVDYAGKEKVDYSDADCLNIPMAVLVNGDSYSAAEFFAAALSEYGVADVVGEKTCGKGYFQNTMRLSDGSAVGLSVGKYFTPKGVSLAGVGITPDVVVPVDEETAAAIYYDQLEPEDDPQIQAALELLEKK